MEEDFRREKNAEWDADMGAEKIPKKKTAKAKKQSTKTKKHTGSPKSPLPNGMASRSGAA